MPWVARWLGALYSRLYYEFGDSVFSLDEAVAALGRGRGYVKAALSELCRSGWCVREGRGEYRLLTPTECVLVNGGLGEALAAVRGREYVPLVRKAVAEIFELFGPSLMGVALFGSVARGEAGPTSDVDLLVVAEGLPASYLERASMLARVVARTRGERAALRRKGLYATLQILAYTPEELRVFHAFYFDLALDAVVLYSRGGYMESLIGDVRKMLEEMGAVRVVRPGGRWYWVVRS